MVLCYIEGLSWFSDLYTTELTPQTDKDSTLYTLSDTGGGGTGQPPPDIPIFLVFVPSCRGFVPIFRVFFHS